MFAKFACTFAIAKQTAFNIFIDKNVVANFIIRLKVVKAKYVCMPAQMK